MSRKGWPDVSAHHTGALKSGPKHRHSHVGRLHISTTSGETVPPWPTPLWCIEPQDSRDEKGGLVFPDVA
jgi:hypothetical protein